MQRISLLTEKIGELLKDEKTKTALEVDLMMDYCRVMYADLIEWRKQLESAKSPISRQSFLSHVQEPTLAELTAAMNEELDEEIAEVTSAYEPLNSTAQYTESVEDEQVDEDQILQFSKAPAPELKAADAPNAQIIDVPNTNSETKTETKESVSSEIASDMVPPKEPTPKRKTFSPPVTPAAPQEQADENIAAAMDLSILTKEEIPTPFAETTIQSITEKPVLKASLRSDIRKYIGINEKYQFISELFGNDVPAYEQAMEDIGQMDEREDAEGWIQDNLLLTPSAEDSDGLYNFNRMLDEYFKRR